MREKINEKIMYTMYKRNSKWLGIIDYKSLCFILIYMFILINILDFLNLNLETSIYIFLFSHIKNRTIKIDEIANILE